MEDQYLMEIAKQLTQMNKKLEKLINSLIESRDKLSIKENKTTPSIGSSGDYDGLTGQSNK